MTVVVFNGGPLDGMVVSRIRKRSGEDAIDPMSIRPAIVEMMTLNELSALFDSYRFTLDNRAEFVA